jgi:hypothetical protein
MTGQTHPLPIDVTPGDDADCGCDERELCKTCGAELCPDCEPDASVRCADGGVHCRDGDGCQQRCYECSVEAFEDWRSDRADAIRKGEW